MRPIIPSDPYLGTGKRLFIGLVVGTALLLAVLLALGWIVPILGFAGIHPALPGLATILFGLAIGFLGWLSAILVWQAYTGRHCFGATWARGISIKFLLPIMELVGKAFGIKSEQVRRSFIKVNNSLTHSIRCEAKQILVLLPHCIQASRCEHRLTYNMDNCQRCGLCPLQGILDLRDKLGVQVAIATGGTIARRIVVELKPRLIIAVACERDLAAGIQDTHPLPVFGIINSRPFGPCLDTCVDLSYLDAVLHEFIIR